MAAALAFCSNAISTESLDLDTFGTDLDAYDNFDWHLSQIDADRHSRHGVRKAKHGSKPRASRSNVKALPFNADAAKANYKAVEHWTSNMTDELAKFKKNNFADFQRVVTNPSFRDCQTLDLFMPRTAYREFREEMLQIPGILDVYNGRHT